MSSSENEVAFLTRILAYDDSAESRILTIRIVQAQKDERCIRRVLRRSAWLLAAALGVTAFWQAYLADESSGTAWISGGTVANGLFGLGAGALISCLVLVSLCSFYRKRLGQRSEEARRFAAGLLEIRLAKPSLPAGTGFSRIAQDQLDEGRVVTSLPRS